MAVLEIPATVTRRGQTTVPAAIRKSLDVFNDGGTIVYRLGDDGQVTVAKLETAEDPVIGAFLVFIAKDMEANPRRLRPLTAGWLDGLSKLVEGVEIDMDEMLSEDDE